MHVTAIILAERQTGEKNEKKKNYERKTNHEWFTVFVYTHDPPSPVVSQLYIYIYIGIGVGGRTFCTIGGIMHHSILSAVNF